MYDAGSDNQPPPLEPYNLFTTDPVLQRAAVREGAAAAIPSLVEFGERVGSARNLSVRVEPASLQVVV